MITGCRHVAIIFDLRGDNAIFVLFSRVNFKNSKIRIERGFWCLWRSLGIACREDEKWSGHGVGHSLSLVVVGGPGNRSPRLRDPRLSRAAASKGGRVSEREKKRRARAGRGPTFPHTPSPRRLCFSSSRLRLEIRPPISKWPVARLALPPAPRSQHHRG